MVSELESFILPNLQKYDVLFERNAKQGSFYLQSKVHRAKECLEAVYQGKGEGKRWSLPTFPLLGLQYAYMWNFIFNISTELWRCLEKLLLIQMPFSPGIQWFFFAPCGPCPWHSNFYPNDLWGAIFCPNDFINPANNSWRS